MDLSQFALGLDVARAAHATSAAPTAGTAVATLASGSLPAGTYDVCVFTRNAPAAAGDEIASAGGNDRNMELRVGAAVRQNRMVSSKQPGGIYEITDIQLDGSTALSVNASANAAASTVYAATILAVRTS
jgi:hypothetical protein